MVEFELVVRRDSKRAEHGAVAHMLLLYLVACDLRCHVWHTINVVILVQNVDQSGPVLKVLVLFE